MWLYQNKQIQSIEDFPEETFGYVYRITNLETGKYYIGRKQLQSKINKKLGKKEIAALPTQRGRAPSKKLIISESNWKEYWGSCKPLLQDVKNLGEDKFKREILMLCKTKKLLTYWELAYQIKQDVLTDASSYNDNILAKFHRQDFI